MYSFTLLQNLTYPKMSSGKRPETSSQKRYETSS